MINIPGIDGIDSKRKLALKITAYVLYGFMLAVVLILGRFPYSRLIQRIEATANERFGLKMEMADASPAFPLGVKLNKFAIGLPEFGNQRLIEASQVYVRPLFLSFLSGKLAFHFSIRAYSGSFKGNLRLARFYDVRSYQLKVRFQEFRLEENPAVSELLGRQISGRISGKDLSPYRYTTVTSGPVPVRSA